MIDSQNLAIKYAHESHNTVTLLTLQLLLEQWENKRLSIHSINLASTLAWGAQSGANPGSFDL